MKREVLVSTIAGLILSLMAQAAPSKPFLTLQTTYTRITLDGHGFLTSLASRQSGKDYLAAGKSSPILSLYENGKPILPSSAKYNRAKQTLTLAYPNGATATVAVRQKEKYIRLQLLALDRRGSVDNIVWGPIHTTISQTIGDIIGVVRDGKWAVGMLALGRQNHAGTASAQ